jgi:hypothetical protein
MESEGPIPGTCLHFFLTLRTSNGPDDPAEKKLGNGSHPPLPNLLFRAINPEEAIILHVALLLRGFSPSQYATLC